MSWIFLSLLSACFLGFYDLAKKHALKENAVLPVLFFGVLCGALIWLVIMVCPTSTFDQGFMSQFVVTPISLQDHLRLLGKSMLVGSSWIFSYFALKNLPISIVSPIRATSPLWTILIAVTLMGERLTYLQWIGVTVILLAFYAFSLVGKLEGIRFYRNKWVTFIILATCLSALSAVYDKYLLQNAALSPATVQAWFSIYLVPVILPFYLLWLARVWPRGSFQWRYSIPLIGILLLIADFLYFTAIAQESALISVISPIRRASVLISFIGGIYIHKEKNFRAKGACIVVLLIGVSLLYFRA
jgi:drug/metabolite transporter (DMT)-like permease